MYVSDAGSIACIAHVHSEAVANLVPIGTKLPANEAQARPLTVYNDQPELQRAIWDAEVRPAVHLPEKPPALRVDVGNHTVFVDEHELLTDVDRVRVDHAVTP